MDLSSIGATILLPVVKRYALNFLEEDRVVEKQEKLLGDKLRKAANTRIGRDLGLASNASFEKLPLTSYQFYNRYFKDPHDGDFLFPLDDYVQAYTSGSMGKPKAFLLPKSAIRDNLMKTGLSFMFLATHDGEKTNFEVGDVVYRNIPGGSYLSGLLTGTFDKHSSGWVKQVPDIDMSFQDKVEYFVANYREIDVAYMTITTLLDEVYPRIDEPFHLKGFITQDRSATVLKDKIREITGFPPKVTYGSTETLFSALPSIGHPGCFFFDWRVIYCEFIPEESSFSSEADVSEKKVETVPLMNVSVGERYQLIATPIKNDLTRYVTPDILGCVSKGDDVLGFDMPVFNFYGRMDKLVVMHNFTRIAEEELISVMKEAEVPYVDFTVRVEPEGSREYMVMYLETKPGLMAEEVVSRLHKTILRVDKDYRDLTDFMKYIPLKVTMLPEGSFRRYLRGKDGMPRIERIGMREDRLKGLLDTVR
jgi:hypothetical protein